MAYIYQPGGQTSGTTNSNYPNLTGLLRPQFQEAYQSSVAASCPAYKMLKTDVATTPAGGNSFNWNIVTQISGAAGWGGIGTSGATYGVTPAPMGRMIGAATATASYKYLMASSPLTMQNVALFNNNPDSRIDLLELLDSDLLTTIGKSYERALFGNYISSWTTSVATTPTQDTTGVLATITSASAAGGAGQNLTITIALGNGHPRQFFRGMQLIWGTYADLIYSNNSGVADAGDAAITNTNMTTRQGTLLSYSISSAGVVSLTVAPNDSSKTLAVVLAANPVTDPVYLACGDGAQGVTFTWGSNTYNPFNSAGNEIFGFRLMGQSSGSLFGVNPSTRGYGSWVGVVDSGGLSGTSTRAWSHQDFQGFCENYAQINAVAGNGQAFPGEDGAELGQIKKLFMSDYFITKFKATIPGVNMLQPLDPEVGLSPKSIKYDLNGTIMEIVISPRHPVDELTIVDPMAVHRAETVPLGPVEPFGGPFTPNAPGAPSSVSRSFMATEAVITDRRCGIGRYTNLAVDNWAVASLAD